MNAKFVEEINATIARLCDWEWNEPNLHWFAPGNPIPCGAVPDYCNDLNAMAEAEKTLTTIEQRADYLNHLFALGFEGDQNPDSFWNQSTASAPARAKAFLLVHGKWKKEWDV